VAVDRVDHQQCPGNVQGSTARKEACCEGGGGNPDIQILGATAIEDLLASEQVIRALFLRVGDCTGLLGATGKVSLMVIKIDPQRWMGEQVAAAAMV